MIFLFLIILVSLFFIYFLGAVISYLFYQSSGNSEEQFMIRLLAGLIFTIVLYSAIKANGYTINMLLLVPLFMFLYSFRIKKITRSFSIQMFLGSLKEHLFLSAVLVIYCLMWFGWLYSLYHNNFKDEIVYAPYSDSVYYSDIAYFLKHNGAENIETVKNQIFDLDLSRQPYHYFELWLTALISELFNVNILFSFLVIMPVLLYGFISVAIYLLALHFGIKPYLAFWMPSLLLLTVYNVPYPIISEFIPSRFLSYADNYTYSFISMPKFLVYFLFILSTIYFYYREQKGFIWVIAMLIIATITSLPSVLGLLFFYFVNQIANKKVSAQLCFAGSVIIIMCLLLYLFYKVGMPKSSGHNMYSFAFKVDQQYIRTVINICAGTMLLIGYLYFPFLLILSLYSRAFRISSLMQSRQNLTMLGMFILAFGAGLISWALIYDKLNSHQFFDNFFHVGIKSLIILFLIQLISGIKENVKGVYKWSFASLVIAYLFTCIHWNYTNHIELVNGRQPYSKVFYEKVSRLLINKVTNYQGAFLYGMEDYKANTTTNHSMVHWPGQIFKFTKERFHAISLTDPLIPLGKSGSKEYEENLEAIHRSVFYAWLERKNLNTSYLKERLGEYQAQFIKENNIQFLILSKYAVLPKAIENMAIFQEQDKISGYRFILLNNI